MDWLSFMYGMGAGMVLFMGGQALWAMIQCAYYDHERKDGDE